MKSYKAKIQVNLKKSVLDPQGTILKQALDTMGFDGVDEVRVGKYLEVNLKQNNEEQAKAKLDEMCEKLFSNPVIEEYRFDLTENSSN